MSGKKMKRMKPVKMWGIVDRELGTLQYSPWTLRQHAVAALQGFREGDRSAYRITRVLITESPTRKRRHG